MKKKLQKICMMAAAIVMFTGVMLLSLEKNDQGVWKFATVSSLAQGGEEEGSIVQVYHYDISTLSGGAPDFADGRAHLFPNPGSLSGIAVVTNPSYTLRSYLYTKTGDNSVVGNNGAVYQIGYSATYTTSVAGISNILVFDSFQETL